MYRSTRNICRSYVIYEAQIEAMMYDVSEHVVYVNVEECDLNESMAYECQRVNVIFIFSSIRYFSSVESSRPTEGTSDKDRGFGRTFNKVNKNKYLAAFRIV